MKSVLGSCGLMATRPCELVHDAITCFPQQMMRWKSRLPVQNVLLSFVVFTTQSTPIKCALAMDRALKGLLPSSNPVLTATLPSSTLVAATMVSICDVFVLFLFLLGCVCSFACFTNSSLVSTLNLLPLTFSTPVISYECVWGSPLRVICTRCQKDFCFRCGQANLTGTFVRKCQTCNSAYIHHRYLSLWLLGWILLLPLWLILFTLVGIVFLVTELYLMLRLRCEVARRIAPEFLFCCLCPCAFLREILAAMCHCTWCACYQSHFQPPDAANHA
eukprot:m.62209 g.62209  ORF g.62209 m.62209 type:complete len:275 (-) comp12391_c2_seq1:1424-2248(-)